jgi:hypothetical protein
VYCNACVESETVCVFGDLVFRNLRDVLSIHALQYTGFSLSAMRCFP